jgi:hypothetical protein
VAVAADDEGVALVFDAALRQRHGLGSGCGFVEHGGIGHRQRGQVTDHGLEIDQRLHAALADLRLIGRVGGVPGRVLQNVAQNHAWGVGAVVALPDEALEHLVFGGNGFEFGQRGGLGDGRRDVHRAAAGDGGRHDLVHQRLARRRTHGSQHQRFVGGADTNVAGDEL